MINAIPQYDFVVALTYLLTNVTNLNIGTWRELQEEEEVVVEISKYFRFI